MEKSSLTKTKIGPTAAILDRTKILLDVHQGPTIGHNCAQYEWDPFIHVWERAAEWSILTKSKIGPTAAILDRTKILHDVQQGPTIGHNCAKYEWDPFIHVWERAVEWFPYDKFMENVIGRLAAILDQNFKMSLRASIGHYRQRSCMTMSRSHD